MLRHLHAFAWLRWRVLMNTLERTGRRDRLQRFSLATESLGPILLFLMMVPSALGLAVAGVVAGFALGRDGGTTLVSSILLRVTAGLALGMSLLAPLFSPAGRAPGSLVRLLLLPIPRSALFASEFAAGLAEPWIAISAPAFLLVPLGALASGRPLTALVTMGAGALFVLMLLGLVMLSSTTMQLVMRSRRRAELFAVIVVFLPLVFSLPAMLQERSRREDRAAPARDEQPARPNRSTARPAEGALVFVPSELYTAAVTRAPEEPLTAAMALAGLLVAGAGTCTLSWLAYRRMLASPLASSGRETKPQSSLWTRRLPGLSGPASAVAMAEVRLALRTPRGRVTLVAPLVVLGVFAVPLLVGREGFSFGAHTIDAGVGLAGIVVVFGILSLAPIALNQFAVDGASLTLQLLAPLTDRDLLAGKAAGLAIVGGVPMAVGFLVAAAAFPTPSLSLWMALILGAVSVFLVLTPVWAIVSAVFPRAATLNSIRSSASNPHPAANFIGIAAALAATAPPAGLAALALGPLDRSDLALPLTGLWACAALLINRALVRPAAAAFARRRENLGLVAQGR